MSEQKSTQVSGTRRRWVVLAALVVLALLVVVLVLALTDRGAADGGDAASHPSTSPSSTLGESSSPDEEPAGVAGEATDRSTDDGDPSQDATADEESEEPKAAEKVTPGPAVGSTDTEATVDQDGRLTQAPSEFGDSPKPAEHVAVKVVKVEKVDGEAHLPGEVGGPSLRFTIEIDNASGSALDLRTAVVNAFYGPDRAPANPLLEPGSKPFPLSVGTDDSARGVFVFNIPTDQRKLVRVEVDLGVGSEIVVFEGSVA